MKKIISILTAIIVVSAFSVAEVKQDILSDIDVDVDVIVEAKDAVVAPITNEEILNIVAQKLNKNPKLTDEQKQKIMNLIQQKLQNKEVPQMQLCVEICKQAELKWRKGGDFETYKKDIENIEKKIKEDLEKAQERLEKTYRKREHLRAHLQQAKEVLNNLVEKGIPVQHALDVVTSIKPKENLDVVYEARIQLEKKLNKDASVIPDVLPQEIRNRIQLKIKEELEKGQYLQLQYQKQQSFEVQTQQNVQNAGSTTNISVQQQEYTGGVILNPVTEQEIMQILNQYNHINKPDIPQQMGAGR